MNYIKIANLTPEDRKKIKSYWTELWGSEFASAIIDDFESAGDKKKVASSNRKSLKSISFHSVPANMLARGWLAIQLSGTQKVGQEFMIIDVERQLNNSTKLYVKYKDGTTDQIFASPQDRFQRLSFMRSIPLEDEQTFSEENNKPAQNTRNTRDTRDTREPREVKFLG